jgi:SAM-dependent methyltransferase
MGWDIFETHAGEYDRWFDSHHEEFLAELARIREAFPGNCPHAIEIGAGSGRFARALGIELAIEPSLALARMARTRGIEVIRARAEKLPLRKSSVLGVLLVTVICYLEDPSLAFDECYRVLEPGGLFVVAFIEKGGLIYQKYIHSPGKHRFLSQARFHTRGEIYGSICKAAFRVERIDQRAGFCIIAARKI